MSYRIAGIDVHKKMLAVVVSDVEIESEFQFERIRFLRRTRLTRARFEIPQTRRHAWSGTRTREAC